MSRLNGKTCVTTAAAQGIGRAATEEMVRQGARVIATDINAAGLEGIAGAETFCLDVTDAAAVADFVAGTGAVDVLFNCAGFVHSGTILESSEEEWDFAFDLNAKAMYRMAKAFLPAMIRAGGGAIINMSSVASSIKGVPNRFCYGASKAAVIGLTKSIAADFVAQGIRCNAICPGTVDTPSLHDRLRATGDYDKAMREFIARQPMGRIAAADEIAALVAYLAGDAAGFVIDGGWNT